jgi:nucleoside phosphorylase/Tfp pilus assembly protein PilF
MEPTRRLTHQDYTVGWICALSSELTAAMAMLDEEHLPLSQHKHDDNAYTLGRIGEHNIVMACLPAGQMGTNSAATVAAQMKNSFGGIRFGLMVGIGAGVPSEEHDIRLGDVVVSKPGKQNGGVVQYDFGRTIEDGRFVHTGSLNAPPSVLLTAVNALQARHNLRGNRLVHYLSVMDTPKLKRKYTYQGEDNDQLFEAAYNHVGTSSTCEQCDISKLVERHARDDTAPIVHYGTIASANQVIRDGSARDHLRREFDILCFEMEAAGLMNNFPCVVIRGVCDYADSHKNKRWQEYAAATAAAYAKELLSIIPENPSDPSMVAPSIRPIFLLPFERDKQFVGREDILSQVGKQLQNQRRVSLHGLGGIGYYFSINNSQINTNRSIRKSQIAIEYAYRFVENNPQSHVFWVYAASAARFDQAYRDIARKMKLPRVNDPDVDVCELVSDWLNKEDSGQWLMILDNADNPDLFFWPVDSEAPTQVSMTKKPLIDYLPRTLNSKQSLVITTRNRQLGEDLSHGERCIEILPFALLEARVLLQLRAGITTDSWSSSDSEPLLEALGRIPLAITQAAAFMRRNKMSLLEYLKDFERNEQNLKDYLRTELQDHRRERGFPNSVFRTWKLSFDLIREQEPRAAAMLSLMAMLDRQKIPETLLRRKGERDINFVTAIGTLNGLSLITKEAGKGIFTMHRLVQLSVHVWLELHNEKQSYAVEALALLADRFPKGEHENRETCELFLPHAQAVLQHQFVSQSSMIHRATLLLNIGCFDWRQGRYDLAYEKCVEAYEINRERLGSEDRQTLTSVSVLASVLQGQGKYKEAEEMGRRALEGREKVLGAEHRDTLTSVNNIASVLQGQGKYEEAEKMYRRVLKEYEKILGAEHPSTLTSVNNLATVLRDQGKYKEAEKMNRRALEGREKVLGAEYPDTLTSVNNLATVLRSQGKYDEAEKMNRRALAGYEKVLGAEHPNTLTSVSNLAGVLRGQGKYEEAEKMNRRALEGREKVLGAEHPNTLTSVNNLATVLQGQGKYEEAEKMNRRALEGREKMLGAEHPDTLASVNDLATILRDQGKYEEAEKMNR